MALDEQLVELIARGVPREIGGAVFSDPVALAKGAAILRRGLARRAARLAAEEAREAS